jgi:hypothetical protein
MGSVIDGAPELGSSDIDLVPVLEDGLGRKAEGAAVCGIVSCLDRIRQVIPAFAGHLKIRTQAELLGEITPRPPESARTVFERFAGRLTLPAHSHEVSFYWRTGTKAWYLTVCLRDENPKHMAGTVENVAWRVATLAARSGREGAQDESAAGAAYPPEAYGDVRSALYARGLALMERAYELGDERLEGEVPPGLYRSRSRADLLTRTYLVVPSASPADLAPAVRAMRRDPRLEVETAKSLKFLLLSVRTIEVFELARLNPELGLAPPSDRALVRHWLWQTQPYFLRTPNKFSPDPPAMCRTVADARLYLERGITAHVTPDGSGTRRAYRDAFGIWPFEETTEPRRFYRGDYLRLWEVADRVHELLAAHPLGRLSDWA